MTEANSLQTTRFTTWAAFLVFSTITLGSSVEVARFDNKKSSSYEVWAIVCSAITFAFTLLAVIAHIIPFLSAIFVGTKIEGITCVVLVGFWAAAVAVISDAAHGLAVDYMGAVENGNLYYFSWAGFVCSITLLVSFLREIFNVDVAGEIKSRSARLTTWSALLATSIVVMGSSANILDQACYKGSPFYGTTYCKRTVFGIVLGVLGTLFSLIVVGLKVATAKAPFLLEAFFSLVLVFLYGFGVGFITSHRGPGAPLGNLYYFTWGSFITAILLIASCIEDYNAAKAMTTQERQEDNTPSDTGISMTPNHTITSDRDGADFMDPEGSNRNFAQPETNTTKVDDEDDQL